jgi:nitrogen fixation/metabolism regulation signal transduction histidine kinase
VSDTPHTPDTPRQRGGATGILLRFISCGLISVSFGVLWRFTLAPKQVRAVSALAGILFLLLGFMVGGLLWYLRDARRRMRDPDAVDDERLVFSFVVFVLMPLAVLVVVGLVWLLALAIGG